ncbi:MAG: hypothetical protein ACJA0N_001835 [Pseudohongiellaceae bacterium]|jgi:hypothetical protein
MLAELLEDTRKILKLFGLGAVLFFVGVGFIQWANSLIPASLQQEVIVLVGVAISGTGFLISMTAQCLLILQRFKNVDKLHRKTIKTDQD